MTLLDQHCLSNPKNLTLSHATALSKYINIHEPAEPIDININILNMSFINISEKFILIENLLPI